MEDFLKPVIVDGKTLSKKEAKKLAEKEKAEAKKAREKEKGRDALVGKLR